MIPMQYTDRDIHTAMAIVREYDRATYERMQRASWCLVATPQELETLVNSHPEYWSDDLLQDLTKCADRGTGVTIRQDETDLPWSLSVFNQLNIKADTDGEGYYGKILNWHSLLATVAVHEFRHVEQPSTMASVQAEIDAFTVAGQFAQQLPAPDGPKILTWNGLVQGDELKKVRAGKED